MAKVGYTRRSLLKSGGAALAATALPAPMLWAQNIKDVTLRQFGTGVSNLNEVAQKVKEDLGFTLEMTALDSDSVTQRAAHRASDTCPVLGETTITPPAIAAAPSDLPKTARRSSSRRVCISGVDCAHGGIMMRFA